MSDLLNRVDAALDLGTALDRYLRRIHTDDHTEPYSDRHSTGHMKKLDMGRTVRIVYGKVVDSIAYCHWYKVQPEGANTTIPCCMLSGTALTPFGVREHNQLHPNAGVYILQHPGSPYGVIIGVEPKHQFDGTKPLSDYISLQSRNSLKIEGTHNFPFTLPNKGTIVDWSGGRPVDGTAAGEMGWFAESGIGLFIDSAMAFLKADENCGLWAFYRDQLLRIAGDSLQVRTAGWEVEALDDQGEFNYTSGSTPYYWEQLGAFEFGTKIYKEKSAQENQISEPYYSVVEPVEDDQQPFHRVREYLGYAGQGMKRMVNTLPKETSGVNRYSQRKKYVGVFDEHVSMTGMYTLRSAKGVRIMKRCLIPVPKLMKRPEDAQGDNEKAYKAASQQGSGPDHKVKDEVQSNGRDPHMVRACGHLDGDAYHVNWEGYVGFHYHEKDYYLPDERDLKAELGSSNIEPIQFGQLSEETFLPQPKPTTAKIDHRYPESKYYPSYSYFELLDDGGVIIGDGYGSEIRMVGGNLYITAPGDIFLQPGRRIVGMAGRDICMRAKNSLDLSTTDKDVRIWSGRNMELGANRGVLIESRSEEVGWDGWQDQVGEDVRQNGIHLQAKKSAVVSYSDLLYLRTGVDGPGTGLYVDAGKGLGNIGINCNVLQTWARGGVIDYLGGGSSVQAACVWTPSGHIIGGSVFLDGSEVVAGSHLVDGWYASASGHIGTALADQFQGLIQPLKDQPLSQSQKSIEDCRQNHNDAKKRGGDQYTQLWDDGLYPDGMCGHDRTINEIQFSFRKVTHYKTTSWRLYESRWQQLGRLWGTANDFWEEKKVVKSGQETYPFPGKEKLVDDAVLYQQDLELFDLNQGVAKERSSAAYQSPQYRTPTPVLLNKQYRIIS